ncbi:MAG: hypothetical protein WCH39_18870 [Schlesneria sp.]
MWIPFRGGLCQSGRTDFVEPGRVQARILKGNFPSEIGVRISPTQWADDEVEISFDYPVSDGRDWVGEARGLLLLVDKKDEDQLSGCQLNFRDNAFTARPI